ncbi:MAG: protein phosphatase CheZ [Acetobacteraceae bacterium]|nr:protein phosphatase CheZ [Acetobacteraceae bacterium]
MHNAAITARAMSERLAQHLAAAPLASREQIETVVRAVLSTLHGDLSPRDTELLAEVEDLGRTIAAAKAEIAALRVDDITVSQIPSATDELDAIVSHTAAATNAILESCEALDALGGSMKGKQADILADATTRIYEACSFQDITGQRIGKVVGTLQAIEAKVAHIVEAFGDPSAGPQANASSSQGEAALLNGPQLPMTAMDQSEIDRLLASFE